MSNPFFYGNPVPANLFLDRREQLRRIVGRIANRGQSTAVVGEPRSGKTSLLRYLSAPEARDRFYADAEAQLVFSRMDAQTFPDEFSQAQFWEHALGPLYERAIVPQPDASLADAYETCKDNEFGTFVLERFLARSGQAGWRLVLVLDEFDVLLHHPVLKSTEFFGGLRALASRSEGALALVIASRRSLSNLNQETQQLSRTGSPYFNFLYEITLKPLPNKDITELLERAGNRFTPDDRLFITEVAGGHPYLLQVAACELWEAYEDDGDEPQQRRREVGDRVYNIATQILSDTWQLWPLETRQALATVGLAHLTALAQQGVCGRVIVRPDAASLKRIHLRQLLVRHFDEEELRTFCSDLGVDYDNLRGEGKESRARELLAYLERRDRLPDLTALGSQERPNADWDAASIIRGTSFQTVRTDQLSRNLGPELRFLKVRGFITKDATVPDSWQVRPAAFLWWLVEQAGWLEGGASELIEAAARGAV
jgi:hypothetical protein